MSADLSFSSPQSDADGQAVRSLKTENHIDECRVFSRHFVSDVLLDANAGTKVPADEFERELDAHIVDLARLSQKAMDDGDPTGAKLWARDLTAAIKSRSPAHQRRLNDEAWAAMTETLDYFGYAGELARQRIEQEG